MNRLIGLLLITSMAVAEAAEVSNKVTKPDTGSRAYWQKLQQAWNLPVEPFRVVGNVYYVGAANVSSFLITSEQGHILLDTGLPETLPQIEKNVAALGFELKDIRYLISSHAHFDHVGGHAAMKQKTGAKVVASEADAELLEKGGRGDYVPALSDMTYDSVKVDRRVKDGDVVAVGDTRLKAVLTPGHTKGCTTWTMKAREGGKTYDVVFFGSTTLLEGVQVMKNPKYPRLVLDFEETFRKLQRLPCDIFLAPHGEFFGMSEKREKIGRGPNPFADPSLLGKVVDQSERSFRRRLDEEPSAAQVKEGKR